MVKLLEDDVERSGLVDDSQVFWPWPEHTTRIEALIYAAS